MGLVALMQDRLGAEVPELSGRLAGALDLSKMFDQGIYPTATPFAHVVPTGEDAQPNEYGSVVHVQALTTLYSVFLTLRSQDPTGARALDRLEELIKAVREALAGWTPVEGGWAFQYVRHRLRSAVGGAFVYEFTFAIDGQLRIAP